MSEQTDAGECCPKFDPSLWDEKILDWNRKKFIKDKVFTLFFMPLNFGMVMKRMFAKVNQAGASFQDGMGLSDHTSKWNMDIYAAVDKDVPGAENTTISGTFFCKVYEGDFRNTGQWCKDFESVVKEKKLDVKKSYMWYTTCPKCAKKYGKNYVAIVGQIS